MDRTQVLTKYVSPQQGCVFGSRLIVECKDRRRKHAKYQLMRAVAQSAQLEEPDIHWLYAAMSLPHSRAVYIAKDTKKSIQLHGVPIFFLYIHKWPASFSIDRRERERAIQFARETRPALCVYFGVFLRCMRTIRKTSLTFNFSRNFPLVVASLKIKQ